MRLWSSMRTAILAATAALLSAGAQAGPIPTNVAAMKSMVDQSTTEVRWGGGYRGGGYGYRGVGYRGGGYGYRSVGYRGGGWAYRGGLGYRGVGYRGYPYRGLGYGAAASGGYYGGYGGYRSYGYAAVPYDGDEIGYDVDYCPPD
jgi:hypothetical protein